MENWWSEVENDLLQCLRGNGAMPPDEIARHVGLSEASTVSLLAMMAREGKIHIRLVESAVDPPGGGERARARPRRTAARKRARVA